MPMPGCIIIPMGIIEGMPDCIIEGMAPWFHIIG